jgi:hypothetical protein
MPLPNQFASPVVTSMARILRGTIGPNAALAFALFVDNRGDLEAGAQTMRLTTREYTRWLIIALRSQAPGGALSNSTGVWVR